MMYVNSSAINTDNTIELETQEILSKIDSLPTQNECKNTELDVSSHLAGIRSELKEVVKDIEEFLDSDEYVTNARELEVFEKEIVKKTDRLAGLLIGYTIQQSVNSEDLGEEED